MAGVVAKNYAQALFNIAVQENKVDRYKSQLVEVNKCIKESPDFFMIMKHPNVTKEDKKEIIAKLFELDEYVSNFLSLLVDKNRFNYIGDICKEFNILANEALNIEVAYITSAAPLTEEEISKIKLLLQKKFNKNIEVETKIDDSCIAGVKVRVKDKVLDNTVAGRLKAIKEAVAKAAY